MDPLISELMHLSGHDYAIVPRGRAFEDRDHAVLTVPRWDIGLLRNHLLTRDSTATGRTLRLQEELDQNAAVLNLLNATNFMSDLSTAIGRIRAHVLRKALSLDRYAHLNIYVGCVLILARSAEPGYYAPNGAADIPTYGTTRRAITGIDAAARALQRRGVDAQVFEPGIRSLAEQIYVFHNSRGVVGIKGAEFANLIWMKPESRVVLIKPAAMNTPPVQRCLAEILRLDYVERETDQDAYPVLTLTLIDQLLTEI